MLDASPPTPTYRNLVEFSQPDTASPSSSPGRFTLAISGCFATRGSPCPYIRQPCFHPMPTPAHAVILLKRLAIRLGLAHHRCMNAYSEDLRKKIVEAKERGMPTVEVACTLRRPLVRQTLRQDGTRRGGSLRPKEELGQTSQGRSARKAALGGGPPGSTGGHPLREARIPTQRGRAEGERVHRLSAFEAYGVQ